MPPSRSTFATTPSRPEQNRNHILAALAPAHYERLRGHLVTEALEQRRVIWDANQPIEAVYFPIDNVTSILALTDSGPIEVATVGNEGLVGLPVFLGANSSPGRAVVQVPGMAQRLSLDVFRREAQRGGQLHQLLHRYTQGFMTFVSQSTVCNRAHNAPQRLARWLLMCRDRVGRNEFSLTHQFLGQMLGVRRATVTETAAALQRARLISYRRGVITIRNGPGLEQKACECYAIVRDEFKRLLGIDVG